MQARTSNPSREQRELENSLLIRCLARTVMERYPNKLHRKQFYDQWSKRHSAESTSRLVSAVKDEYQNFLGWCALHGCPASHSLLTQYLLATSPVNTLLSARSAPDTGVSFSALLTIAPWWSELPHLAPRGASHA